MEAEVDERFGEALCFPEVTCLADSPEAVANLMVENVLQLLAEVPNGELHRRVVEGEVESFARRVIGQPDAVSLFVNLLATFKAGLNRERKPLVVE